MPAPCRIDQHFFNRRIMINSQTGCWNWKGARAAGYGSVRINYKHIHAHRLSYITFVGEIPKGHIIRHLCDNRSCVNPTHLELGTYSDNLLDRYHGTRSRRNG